MRRISFIFLFIFLINSIYAQTFSRRPEWSQSFFSIGTHRLNNWTIFKGKFSFEDQYYTDSIANVFIRNGCLHLKATADKREDKICSSARVSTKGFKSFLYGKIVIRAKMPLGKGIFPAIWMLREDHGTIYPLGEIDIVEYIECFEGKEYHTTIHIVEREPGKDEIRHKHYKSIMADMSQFHIYTLEWTPQILRLRLDDEEVYSLHKSDVEFWPFDAPYFLIMNVAYGSWGAKCGKDDSIFPREMLVDWIKYYPLVLQ